MCSLGNDGVTRKVACGIKASAAEGCPQGLRSVAWGSAVGLLGTLALSRLLSALVVAPDMPDLTYGAGVFNAETFLGVLGGLATVVLIASLIPVWRASRVDPMIALRET